MTKTATSQSKHWHLCSGLHLWSFLKVRKLDFQLNQNVLKVRKEVCVDWGSKHDWIILILTDQSCHRVKKMQQQLWSSYMNVAHWSRQWYTDVRDKKQYLPVQQEDCIDPRKVLLCSALIVGLYMIATTSPVTSPELIGAGCSVSNLDQFNALAALQQLQAASANSLTAPTTAVPRLKPVVTTRRFLGNSVRMHPYPYYYVQYVPISSKPELVGPPFTLFLFLLLYLLFSSCINGFWHLNLRRKFFYRCFGLNSFW